MAKYNNARNPNNNDNVLFRGLTRLLSGPITNYRRQNPQKLKRQQLDKYKFRSLSGHPFRKSSNNPLTQIYTNSRNNQNRAERYIDFDQMEFDPIISSVLDIYADEMTTSSALNKLLTIVCHNQEIKDVLEHLFYTVMNIEYNLWGWCREMCKKGDYFLYIDIDEKEGIKFFIGLPAMEVERIEGEDKTNPSYVQFQWNSGGLTFENWQVAHFRILGQDKFHPYGVSVLDGARRVWRQLKLLEDAVMAYRIVRSPERRAFYIDVGGIPEKDVEQHIQRIITEMKRNPVLDPETGQVDLRNHQIGVDSDYFIPVVGNNSGTRIETLPGGHYPVRKDSDIPLLDGRVITIEELAIEYENGKENWVYSIQDKTQQIVPGKVIWCGKNYTCNKIHRIWLDDGSYSDMAPEHPVILRDGSSKRADELKENDSLMPFYFEISNKVKEKLKGYPTIYNPSVNKYEFIHRLVAGSVGGKEKALQESGERSAVIHHVDFDKENNRPDNLKWMGFWEHRDFHHNDGSVARKTLRKYLLSDKHKENVKKRIADPNDKLHQYIYGEKNINRLTELNRSSEMREKTILRNKERWNNETFRKEHSGENHNLRKKWKKLYSSYTLLELQEFCKKRNITFMKDFISDNESFLKSKTQCWEFLKFHGIKSWKMFKDYYLSELKNHKVSKIEVLTEIDDVYCMTVAGPNDEDDRHNFALCSKGVPTIPGKLNGFFVKNTGDVDDVKYLRDNMLAALKVPHSYLISSSDSVEDKTTLSQKDIEFARTIQRVQRSVISELEKIGVVHLYTLGYRGKDLTSFKLKLNNPSKIAELQELEHWKTKFEVAAAATEGLFSKRWVAQKILGLSDEEFLRNTREMFYDAKLQSSLEKLVAIESGDTEGMDDLGLGDETDNVEGGDEDQTLLAAPGKRHDDSYLTPGAKGKVYKPTNADQRPSGARKRHMKGQYSDEMGRAVTRNLWKGSAEMKSLSRGIYEELEQQTSYENEEEVQLFENNREITIMLERLTIKGLGNANRIKNKEVITENKNGEIIDVSEIQTQEE